MINFCFRIQYLSAGIMRFKGPVKSVYVVFNTKELSYKHTKCILFISSNANIRNIQGVFNFVNK